jgi:hypothetical protein
LSFVKKIGEITRKRKKIGEKRREKGRKRKVERKILK